MRQGRVLEIIKTTDECIARALEFVGTHNASADELAAIERFHATRTTVPVPEEVLALAEIGRLQKCPAGFWRELRRAAHLTGIKLPDGEAT